jgi:hypothetical protein
MFLSLTVGIIGSIEMFFNITKQMESELSESKSFYVLGCDIFKYLSLNKEKRIDDEREFLNEIYGRYIKLVESSIILKKKVVDKLNDIALVRNDNMSTKNIEIDETPELYSPTTSSEDEKDNGGKKYWFRM